MNDPAKQTALAKVDPPAVADVVPVRPAPLTDALPSYFTSWDENTKEGKRKVMEALLGQPVPLMEHANKPITVVHVLAHWATFTNEETGEVKESPRIVFWTPEGDMLVAVSEGVRKSLALIMKMEGKPPWQGGLTIIPREVRTGKKRWHKLDLVETPESAPARTKKAG